MNAQIDRLKEMNAKKTLSDLYMTWQCKTLEKFVDCFATVCHDDEQRMPVVRAGDRFGVGSTAGGNSRCFQRES